MLKARVDPQNGGSKPLDLTQKLQRVSKRDETNFQPIIKKKQYKTWAPIKYSTLTYVYFMFCHSVLSTVSQLRLSRSILRGEGGLHPPPSVSVSSIRFFYSSQSFVRIFMTSLVWFMSFNRVRKWRFNTIQNSKFLHSELWNEVTIPTSQNLKSCY